MAIRTQEQAADFLDSLKEEVESAAPAGAAAGLKAPGMVDVISAFSDIRDLYVKYGPQGAEFLTDLGAFIAKHKSAVYS